MNEMDRLKFWIQLLEMEVESLRSVLSEYGNPSDHRVYVQWINAEAIDQLKNSLVQP